MAAAAVLDDPYSVRNTCIMAHVDHGKTTLADHLVASGGGGLLNPKMAGKVRFMDHLEEEQRRAITMKSASVALRHGRHRVHLIDSPGHIDFCYEVSAAARVADSALIVVDVVEGVHIQTHAALRQAFVERLRPCLVLNKLDRFITELHLEPEEAYVRLCRILAEVNSIYSALRSGSYFSSLLDGSTVAQQVDDDDDGEDAFVPRKGNVVFACARDGWGFRIHHFAELIASGHPDMTNTLLGGLWGPYYWDKEKRKFVGKEAMASMSQQPMFVEFVLKRLWKAYEHGLKEDGASWLRDQVVKTFNLKVSTRELQNKDAKAALRAVLRAWLPLAETVMNMLVDCTPDPIAAQRYRVPKLMPERELALGVASEYADIVAEAEKVRKCVTACSTKTSAPVVVFVSKMFAVSYKDLLPTEHDVKPHNHRQETSESEECFLAFARVFSGVLRAGQKVFVLSPLYDPVKGDAMQKHVQEVELQQLYEMLGQSLRPVASVAAGNVVAIRGLGNKISKTATLSSTRNCWPFSSMMFQVSPMLKVSVEPSNLRDLGALRRGLGLLNRADPLVEYTISGKGEHVLAAAGEIHLELCVKNLRERFAKVELQVSKPLVSFKETIEGEGVGLGLIESLRGPPELVERTTPDGKFAVRVKVFRLPDVLTKMLEDSAELLVRTVDGKSTRSNGFMSSQRSQDDGSSATKLRQRMISAIDSGLGAISAQVEHERLEKYRNTLLGHFQRIWAIGPLCEGSNFLISPDVKSTCGAITSKNGRKGILVSGACHVSKRLGFLGVSAGQTNNGIDNSALPMDAPDPEVLRNSIVKGFQLATSAGPLCDEPMWGLSFIVEPYIFADNSDAPSRSYQDNTFSCQVTTTVKEACLAAVLQSKPRIVEPMYFCELTMPSHRIGAVCAVLRDCRGRVLREEMHEGTSLFTMHAHLPVAESSEFSEKLRNRTSGAVHALLAFSHWEAIPTDPFFIPKTQEEMEEFGDRSNMGPNLSKTLMNSVRRRKGLHVEEKVVEHGTKQRTRAKKV